MKQGAISTMILRRWENSSIQVQTDEKYGCHINAEGTRGAPAVAYFMNYAVKPPRTTDVVMLRHLKERIVALLQLEVLF